MLLSVKLFLRTNRLVEELSSRLLLLHVLQNLQTSDKQTCYVDSPRTKYARSVAGNQTSFEEWGSCALILMPFSFSSISINCTRGLKLLCVYVCTVQLLIQDLEFKRIGSKTISHSTASHVSPHCILKWPGVRIGLFVPLTSEIWILAWHVGR